MHKIFLSLMMPWIGKSLDFKDFNIKFTPVSDVIWPIVSFVILSPYFSCFRFLIKEVEYPRVKLTKYSSTITLQPQNH